VVLAEHRLERVAQYADQILYLTGPGERPILGPPDEVLAQVALVPPLVELGRRLGWKPLPLTVREARRASRELRARLLAGTEELAVRADGSVRTGPGPGARDPASAPAVELRGVRFSYAGDAVLRGVDLEVARGEFVAVMGRNGAGKSTLLKHCIGLLQPEQGYVRVLGRDTREIAVEELARDVGYVPQNPNALLFEDSVAQELKFTRRAHGGSQDEGAAEQDGRLLERLGLGGMAERYPRDLSGGERQRVALAAVLVGDPEVILLDEPTRGLDYAQKRALARFLSDLRVANGDDEGTRKTVVMVTHDVELVAQCAERVVLMGDGEIVVDGPVRQVMSGSQVFASQVNKLFRDPRFLTVSDVMDAIGSGSDLGCS
jgi:energy-coupling factor transport system ATP-binding protein